MKSRQNNQPPNIKITADKPIDLEIQTNDLNEIFKKNDDNKWTLKTRVNACIQIIIILFTIVSICISDCSWKSAVTALQKSDSAQKKSTEQFSLINKPIVWVSNFEWKDLYGSGRITADVTMSNIGNHVARLFKYNYALSQVEYHIDTMMKKISDLDFLEKNLYLVKETAHVTSTFTFDYLIDSVTLTNIKNGYTTFNILIVLDYEALIDGKKYRNMLYFKTYDKDLKKAKILINKTIPIPI